MSEQDQSKRVLELCDRALELPDIEREQFWHHPVMTTRGSAA